MGDDPLRGKAERKAYRLLAIRAHSEKELRDKLLKGGFPEALVAGVMERCRELGYLNDAAYARQRARELALSRLAGNRRILYDLGRRGVGEETAREAIADVRGELSEEAAIDRLLGRKVKGAAAAGMDERQKVSLARGLMGRGFPMGLIMKKLKQTEDGFHDDDGE